MNYNSKNILIFCNLSLQSHQCKFVSILAIKNIKKCNREHNNGKVPRLRSFPPVANIYPYNMSLDQAYNRLITHVHKDYAHLSNIRLLRFSLAQVLKCIHKNTILHKNRSIYEAKSHLFCLNKYSEDGHNFVM